jgi:hypothetical protein
MVDGELHLEPVLGPPLGMAITPALLTSMSMSGWLRRIRSAASRTDASDARSSGCSSSEAPGISFRIEPRASSALPWSRDAITTNAPLRASSRETSSPMPPFAPVTTATLPDWSGMSAADQVMLDATSSVVEGKGLRTGPHRTKDA